MNERSNLLKPTFISVPYQNNHQHGKQKMKKYEVDFHAALRIVDYSFPYICDRTVGDIRGLLLSIVTHQGIHLKEETKET